MGTTFLNLHIRTDEEELIRRDGGCHKENGEDAGNRIYRIAAADKDGVIDFSHISCFRVVNDQFVKVHEYRYPPEIFSEDCVWLFMNYDNELIFAVESGEEISWEEYEPILREMKRIPEDMLLEHKKKPEIIPCFGEMAVSGDYGYWFVLEHLEKIDWRASGYRFAQRKVTAAYAYEKKKYEFYNDHFLLSGSRIIFARFSRTYDAGQERILDVRFFDLELKLLRHVEIPLKEDLPFSFTYMYDEEGDILYLSNIAVKLKTQEIFCPYPDNINICTVLPCRDSRKNIYVADKHCVYVLSPEYQLLSRHKFKGFLQDCYVNKGGCLCFITVSGMAEKPEHVKKG